MKRMLVTGGAGFIGCNFIKHMFNKYNQDIFIVNYDLLTYAGHLVNLKEVENNENYRFVLGDITDKALLEKTFQEHDFDYVINFAAESHVDRSIEEPSVFVKTNVLGTQILLDVAMNAWIIGNNQEGYPLYKEGSKFIQISTDEVYGTLTEQGKFTEVTSLDPNSPYSASKASAGLLVQAYYKTFNFPMNITRCSNNYGPYQYPEKLIPVIINKALSGEQIPIYGDGLQVRDWLHVYDHCSAIEDVIFKGRVGEIYNIGGNNEMTNIELVKTILQQMNKSEELITYVKDRLGHDRRYAIDNTKITTELGWKPKQTFRESIKETIDWYISNQEWMEQVLKKEI